MRSAESANRAMMWQSISSFGWIGFSAVFLWHTLIFTGKTRISKNPLLCIFLFLIPALLITRQWQGYLINDFVKRPFGWNNIWSDTFWPAVFYVYYISFIMISLLLLLRYKKRALNPPLRKQASIIINSTVIYVVLGTATDVFFPQIGYYRVPPLGSVFTLIWAGGLVLAITKYGLMSITPAAAAEDILESMADSLVLIDPKGRIAALNKAACRMTGYREKELKGKPVDIIFSQKGGFFESPVFRKLLNEGVTYESKVTYLTREGLEIPVSFSGSLMRDKSGSVIGIVGIARDMRESIRKKRQLEELYRYQADIRERLVKARMQEKIARNEKLAMVGRLAGSVSHEIRTPLASIRNAAFYLEKYGSIEDEESKKFLDIMLSETKQVEEIVHSLLDFSRTTEINISEVDISEVLDKAIASVKEDKDIEYIKEISPDAATIKADPLKLGQLLGNLVRNAAQAIGEKGSITVSSYTANSSHIIKVSDTGEGMDDETLDKIFEPLFTTKSSGIGLGMAIVRDIIEAHGWSIEVKSEKGKGTEFIIKAGRIGDKVSE